MGARLAAVKQASKENYGYGKFPVQFSTDPEMLLGFTLIDSVETSATAPGSVYAGTPQGWKNRGVITRLFENTKLT